MNPSRIADTGSFRMTAPQPTLALRKLGDGGPAQGLLGGTERLFV
ncbi:hypothetical protein [uncultured Hoeflea sp.]